MNEDSPEDFRLMPEAFHRVGRHIRFLAAIDCSLGVTFLSRGGAPINALVACSSAATLLAQEIVMNTSPHSPNHILASLPAKDFEFIRPHLQFVDLTHSLVLARAGDAISRVYFPHTGVISLVVSLSEGEMIEVAMIGRDGVFGASMVRNVAISLNDAMVQLPGTAFTLEVPHFRKAVEQSLVLREALVRQEQGLLIQAQQSAACNAYHTVESRLSRWLLRMHDLFDGDELPLTQGFLAEMIGVRRNSVSLVANTLQQAGLIRYRRGHIEITNLEGLQETACECYETVKMRCESLLTPDFDQRPRPGIAMKAVRPSVSNRELTA